MSSKFTICVAALCLSAIASFAKPGDDGNNQDKRSKSWFSFGGKRPGPNGDNAQGGSLPPGSYVPHGQSDVMTGPNGMMVSPTPGSKNPVYPGISKRTTPKMSTSPDFNAPSGSGYPGDAGPPSGYGPAYGPGPGSASVQMPDNMPHFGETRPEYERRIQGVEDKNSQMKMRSTYPGYNSPAGTSPYGTGPKYSNPSIAPGTNSPAKQKLLEKAQDFASPQPTAPQSTAGTNDVHKMQVDFHSAHDRILRALQQRDYATVNAETSALQQQLEIIKSNAAGLDVGARINVMTMNHWADEAVSNLSDGASSQEDGKIQMGLQNLEKAADALGTPAPPAGAKAR